MAGRQGQALCRPPVISDVAIQFYMMIMKLFGLPLRRHSSGENHLEP